jgi:hypothetical protein
VRVGDWGGEVEVEEAVGWAHWGWVRVRIVGCQGVGVDMFGSCSSNLLLLRVSVG